MKAGRAVVPGFALGELIIVLMLGGIVTGGLLTGLIALINGLHPRSMVVAGEKIPVAPTFGAFPAAVRLHEAFTRELTNARAVYVFGGSHPSLPAGEAVADVGPLTAQALPVVTDFSAGLPLAAARFYERFGAALGGLVTGSPRETFSVLVVGERAGSLAITCLVQVGRSDLPRDGAGGPYVLRDVRLWTTEGMQRYAFAERVGGGSPFVGAVHTWLRHDPGAGTLEEGPACLVFPDPWLYGAATGAAGIESTPPFSRFSYFVPVSS